MSLGIKDIVLLIAAINMCDYTMTYMANDLKHFQCLITPPCKGLNQCQDTKENY